MYSFDLVRANPLFLKNPRDNFRSEYGTHKPRPKKVPKGNNFSLLRVGDNGGNAGMSKVCAFLHSFCIEFVCRHPF